METNETQEIPDFSGCLKTVEIKHVSELFFHYIKGNLVMDFI